MTPKPYDDMTTTELAYHRSEVKAQIKRYLFRLLTDIEKQELRVLRAYLKRLDAKLQARQLRLPEF